MLEWLLANCGSILVVIGLIALTVLIILSLRKDKKQGRSSCGSSCAGCPMSGHCHEKNNGQ